MMKYKIKYHDGVPHWSIEKNSLPYCWTYSKEMGELICHKLNIQQDVGDSLTTEYGTNLSSAEDDAFAGAGVFEDEVWLESDLSGLVGRIGSPKRSYCMTDTPNDGVVLSSLQDLFDDIKEARINRAQII
jgi:hypothetical protein